MVDLSPASLAKLNIPAPPAMAKAAEDAMLAKATTPLARVFWLALTGGAYIAIGFISMVTSQQGLAGVPTGFAKVLGGATFSLGLIFVLLSGSDLFTGTTMTLMPVLSKRLALPRMLVHWGVSIAGNLVGSVFMALLILWSGTAWSNKGAWGLVVLNTTTAKLHHTWVEAFFLGVLCNLLVCLAVWLTFSARSTIDKALATALPVIIFVAAGFEHSVANMFMLPMGWLIKSFAPESFWQSEALAKAGKTAADFDGITIPAIVWDNLIPVILGNIVGGALLIGAYFWVAYRRPVLAAERAAAAEAATATGTGSGESAAHTAR